MGLPELKISEASTYNRLSDAVYDTVMLAVENASLSPGEVLSEVSIAKQLNVSRTPVHDAFRQLAKDGILEQTSGHRARIVEYSVNDVFEIFELRKVLEGEAAALAAGKMDLRQLVPLREKCLQLRDTFPSADWYNQWRKHDMEFHRSIAEYSGNKRLAADISRYWMLRCGVVHVPLEQSSHPAVITAHLEILDALQSRNSLTAKQAMVQHITNCQTVYLKQLTK